MISLQYNKTTFLLALCLCLGAGPEMAGAGLEDEDFFPPEDKGSWLQRTFKPTDQQKRDALVKKADKNLQADLAAGKVTLKFEAAKEQTRSIDKNAQKNGELALRLLTSVGTPEEKFKASFYLFQGGRIQYAHGALEGAGKPGGAHWGLVVKALLDNPKTNSMGMDSIYQELMALQNKEDLGNASYNKLARQQAKEDVKKVIIHMTESKNKKVRDYGNQLKTSLDGQKLFGLGDKILDKAKDAKKAIKRKIKGKTGSSTTSNYDSDFDDDNETDDAKISAAKAA